MPRWSIIQTNKDFEVDLVGEDDVTSSGRLRYFLQNEAIIIISNNNKY